MCSLWSAALAQKGRPGCPILCLASCRKLAANCGSMRRCCFVWSDKVQTKPSGPHWPVAPFAIVAVNVGPCDAWLVLNIGRWSWGLLRGLGAFTPVFRMSPSVWGCCLLGLIVTRDEESCASGPEESFPASLAFKGFRISIL